MTPKVKRGGKVKAVDDYTPADYRYRPWPKDKLSEEVRAKMGPIHKCINCKKSIGADRPLPHGVKYICEECSKPDWAKSCENCGAKPIHPMTGLCGPCTFGEAETSGGNW